MVQKWKKKLQYHGVFFFRKVSNARSFSNNIFRIYWYTYTEKAAKTAATAINGELLINLRIRF